MASLTKPDQGLPPTNLEGVIDRLVEVCDTHADGNVSVSDLMATIGPRSFGPLLLVPGLMNISPIAAIPLVPASLAVIELLVSGQVLLGKKHLWIPRTIAERSLGAARLRRGLERVRPYAKFVDRLVRPRLTFLTHGIFLRLIALLCVQVALVSPIIELVPFAGTVPNAAIIAFGLAITAHDGLWVLIALLCTGASAYLIALAFWP
jgi:hypothetical protein